MNNFACLPDNERAVYFQETADRLDWSPGLVEKDFWVCWILRQLFSLEDIGKHFTFKGGTSLSKVYNVIKRFSEDVDISIEREYLGYGGDKEPEKSNSNKEQRRRIKGLQQACQEIIINIIMPKLNMAIFEVLDKKETWTLRLDPLDPDQQTILFQYPSVLFNDKGTYLRPIVKIELGARSDHWPVEQAKVIPYVAEHVENAMSDREVTVRVLSAERTFWEKATILHMLYHQPDDKETPSRMSRHYYDTYQISLTPILERALDQPDLLRRVAEHKSIFFASAWANYTEAKPGTLRLAPKSERLKSLLKDYQQMNEMFFEEPPAFDFIINALTKLEERINVG